MIVELKKEIEKKIGVKVNTRGDCELISLAILDLLDITISYNTIRRLYGLAPYTKPNTKTLNTLAKFVGYNNYLHFSQNFSYKEKRSLFHITYKAIYDDNDNEILDLVKKTKSSQEDFIGFITMLIRELFRKKKYTLIEKIFNLDETHSENFSYSELLYLGNSVGLILREEQRVHETLGKNINFLNCIYLTFVDYSSLNTYYGQWLEALRHLKTSDEISMFNNALLQFKNFLNLNVIKEIEYDFTFKDDLNPILSSRLLALKFLSDKNCDVSQTLTNYYKTHSKKVNVSDYSFELYTTSILTKNIEIMRFLIENLECKIEFFYQKNHINSFYLMCAFYFKFTKNKTEELKNFKRFSIHECRYSYEEFIDLMHQIYLYHNAKLISEKILVKKNYFKLSQKLNYPYFSEKYLLDYFN
tara:strand:+ start:1821 stop:3065 length:1245 start_codon:yes stop_codon:yes gene_type:complete